MDATLEQARTYFLQGIEHFEAGRLEPARKAFEASLTLAPGRPSVLGNLGITLFHLGRAREAVPLLRQATVSDPGYLEAWSCLGLAQEALGQWQDAAHACARALALGGAQPALLLSQGQCLARLGQAGEALRAFEQALMARPDFAEAWSASGSLLRELGRLDEAVACFEKAIAHGGDAELNGYYLASVRGETVLAPPRKYVETLFDDYAAEFQHHVTTQLGYQGHAVLLKPLAQGERRYRRVVDLGCGTGLCAPLLRPVAEVIDGVDISAAMLEQARKLGIYRKLAHADVASWLEAAEGPVDLVVAADVFIYVGDLSRIFPAVRRLLAPGGRFAFTVEEPVGAEELQLLPSLRYAHSEAYVRRLAAESGLAVQQVLRAPIRSDQERAVQGLYIYMEAAAVY